MNWDKLKIFHAVAEAGSFTSATVILNISQSAISRQIQDLELDLKTVLFIRHQKGVTLTEQGENLFYAVNNINYEPKFKSSELLNPINFITWLIISLKDIL